MASPIVAKTFTLSHSHLGLNKLSEGKRKELIECCIKCLQESSHSTGVGMQFDLSGKSETVDLVWDISDLQFDEICSSFDEVESVEHGAEALSIIALHEFTPYKVIKRAFRGTGIDYWASKKIVSGNEIFLRDDVRLEISGIFRESSNNTVAKRVQVKQAQSRQSDSTCTPAYIAVVEFGHPQACMVIRNE